MKRDYIISKKNNTIIAVIEIQSIDNDKVGYKAKLIENHFPKELLSLIGEFHKTVDSLEFSLLDSIESRIQAYQLYLRDLNLKIFDLLIEGQNISFYSKYPTANGFIDNYPE
ncbi:hypothetical protein AAG747_05665 [Rapidithrix thailandica]|uniref:Uncharacterized protein n=1 Tax=Rapidithrix thailandica TaxID=413964 RepID=A0AAW9S7T0_9BACT